MISLKILCFLLLITPGVALGEKLVLLSLPLNDDKIFNYEVEQKDKCSFAGVTSIELPQFVKTEEDASLIDKVNNLQKKINLEIEESEITKERINFSLKAAENIVFEFFYTQGINCKLIRVLKYNEKRFNLKAIKIDYNTFLKSPVLEKITIESQNEADEDLYLYPWALRGQMSLYELNLGPAINIHTNVRVNNQNKFEKNNPVVEPIPAFFFRYGPLFLNKNGLGSLLYNYKDLSLVGMGLREGEPYKGEGLLERDQGIFFGAILKFNLAEFTYYKDFFNDKGYNLKLNLAPEFYYKLSWKFSPQVFVQYWDNKYVDYYYGVSQNETMASGFRYYKGSKTINFGATGEVMHFRGKWTYLLTTGVKVYGREVFESPTVSRNKEFKLITSVLYKFF